MATVPTMVINVVVVGGSQRTHIYALPKEDKVKAEQVIGAIGEALVEPFMGKRALMHLHNPNMLYNPAHVVSISTEIVGSKELEEAFHRLQQKHLGFV